MSKEKMEMSQKKTSARPLKCPLCAGFKAQELGAGAGLTKK